MTVVGRSRGTRSAVPQRDGPADGGRPTGGLARADRQSGSVYGSDGTNPDGEERSMTRQTLASGTDTGNVTQPQYEAVIIGAGVCGIYQLYRLTELGVHTTVLEGGADLGGTWYWNRYPGCRFDSESYTYGFSFSKELLDEWHWKER